MILVAVLSIVVMTRLRIGQSLIISVVTVTALWGLAQWTDGLAVIEIAIWSMLAYALAYLLFSWITRYKNIVPVLISILLVVLVVRIVVNL
jgi:hypothetical protein